jgi:glycosyltransferase involved in cell wall biosynthesis
MSGLPLVLDYRDEWELTIRFQENKQFGRLAQWVNTKLERRITRRARLILATSDASARALESMRNECRGLAPVRCIPNGFDPDDFSRDTCVEQPHARSRFRLVYTGTLFTQTSAQPLVEAVRRLCETAPEIAAKLELVFAGRRTPHQEALIATLVSLPVTVVLHPYLDHSAAIALMRSADLLCATLTDAPGAARAITAKIFEYMACRRPILAIIPPGDLWDILEDYPAAERFVPSKKEAIASALRVRLAAWQPGSASPLVDWEGSRYDRREQARVLASLLSGCVGASSQPD